MCPGIGYINRGYETHIRELFDLLKDEKDFDIVLLKGGGNSIEGNELKISHLRRNSKLTILISKLSTIPISHLEQYSFSMSSLWFIIFNRPSIIYLQDYFLCAILSKIKKVFKLNYTILFCNGSSYSTVHKHADFVQQLLEIHAKRSMEHGANAKKQLVLSHGFHLDKFERKELTSTFRIKLGLPINRKIILSVGALNVSSKRMDYLIREFSILDRSKFYLIIIGQKDAESEKVYKLASQLLCEEDYLIKTIPYSEIEQYYFAADIFCLTSLIEGFGKVYVEALIAKLPVIADDNEVAREVLNEFGFFANLSKDGELSTTILKLLGNKTLEKNSNAAYDFVKLKYNWINLKPKYVEMFKSLLRNL